MPIHTRSGKVLHTAGDPNAPSNFFDPKKWTKPKKRDDDRTPIALFVVDEIPVQVNTCNAQLGKKKTNAKHDDLVDG